MGCVPQWVSILPAAVCRTWSFERHHRSSIMSVFTLLLTLLFRIYPATAYTSLDHEHQDGCHRYGDYTNLEKTGEAFKVISLFSFWTVDNISLNWLTHSCYWCVLINISISLFKISTFNSLHTNNDLKHNDFENTFYKFKIALLLY